MTLSGIDISNLQGHPDSWPSQAWYPKYQSAQFVLCQAIEPPLGYLGHDFIDPETGKRGYTGVQLRQCVTDGKKVGIYAWLWFGLPDPYSNIRSRLDCAPPSIRLDMRPWVDVEDTVAISTVIRRADTLAARKGADDWAAERGLPPSGGYSGQWFIDGYLNGWWPAGWLKWWAVYNDQPGSILGGDVVAHQWTSTPIDMDEILETEIVSGVAPVDACQVYRDALDKGVQRLWIETAKKTTLSKKIVSEIAAEMFQALQA